MLRFAKLIYYRVLVLIYGSAISCADVLFVNSTWTARNVRRVSASSEPIILYPPCDTALLEEAPLTRKRKGQRTSNCTIDIIFLSVAQFRPEKDHMMQILAFMRARSMAEQNKSPTVSIKEEYKGRSKTLSRKPAEHPMLTARLQIVGSCRNEADEARLRSLKEEVSCNNLEHLITFHESVPFPTLIEMLTEADAGLHTMVDEHFGISVVEFMAAGMIPIAHNSAGPKEDIVGAANEFCARNPLNSKKEKPLAGFLADSVEEYAQAMLDLTSMSAQRRLQMAQNGRDYVKERFSIKTFSKEFQKCTQHLI